jgi:hypothetical protein
MTYDKRHGVPFDRGGADFWYGRPHEPHYFVGATYKTDKVELADMTPESAGIKKTGGRNVFH